MEKLPNSQSNSPDSSSKLSSQFPDFALKAIASGLLASLAFISQSISLSLDTPPSTVAFLAAFAVIICPILEAVVKKKPMGLKDAPQTWLAGTLCLLGVGVLELYHPGAVSTTAGTASAGNTASALDGSSVGMFSTSHIGMGDVWALIQALGFGSCWFVTEELVREDVEQVLPVTAVQVSVMAFLSMCWVLWVNNYNEGLDGGIEKYGLMNLLVDPELRTAAQVVVWIGIISTALNRCVETASLGRVGSSDAAVIVSTETIWAAIFSALILHEQFGMNDYVGGALIVGSCMSLSLKKDDFVWLLRWDGEDAMDSVDNEVDTTSFADNAFDGDDGYVLDNEIGGVSHVQASDVIGYGSLEFEMEKVL